MNSSNAIKCDKMNKKLIFKNCFIIIFNTTDFYVPPFRTPITLLNLTSSVISFVCHIFIYDRNVPFFERSCFFFRKCGVTPSIASDLSMFSNYLSRTPSSPTKFNYNSCNFAISISAKDKFKNRTQMIFKLRYNFFSIE